VGNGGPGGLSTVTTETTKTVYPVAESFNNLFQWAPATMFVLVVLACLFLRFTTYGTYLYAIGGNETAARLSGINADRIKLFAYALTGFLAGLASVFMTSKLHTLDPNLAKGYELKVIAAVVIGGTSLMGGEGTVWGTLIGACLLYVMNYALVHLGMEDIWSDLFVGGIIIVAAVIDSTRSRFPAMAAAFRRGIARTG
jgi:ribose transport system permease protein